MDARTRAFPPLPRGAHLRIVLPLQGDLRARPLVPLAFLQQLYIHCPNDSQHVYRRFRVARKFIVMARTGDMYAKSTTAEVRMDDLPGRTLLPLPPPLAPWDVVKVLDLVQCYTYPPGDDATKNVVPNVRWELVRVRWRNSRETWIPIELMASQSPTLLQEFYVNCINSWAFHNRVDAPSWTRYRTEIELWLQHPEFQKYYEHLRRRATRQQGAHAALQPNQSQNSTGTTARIPASTASAIAATQSVDVKDRRLTAEAARASQVQPVQPSPPSVQPPPRPPQPQPFMNSQPPGPPRPPPPQSQSQSQPRPAFPHATVQLRASEHMFPQQPHRFARGRIGGSAHPTPFAQLPARGRIGASAHPTPFAQPPARPQMFVAHPYQQYPQGQPPRPMYHQPPPYQPHHYQQPFRPHHPPPPQQQHQYQYEHHHQNQHQHQHPHQSMQRPPPTNGARMPHPTVASLSERAPLPPTPPRPSQDPRPSELRVQQPHPLPPPTFSLPTRPEPSRPPLGSGSSRSSRPPLEHYRSEQRATPQSNQRTLERQTTKSPNKEDQQKEKRKKKTEKEARLSQSEASSSVREKEKKKRKKRDQNRDQSPETPRTAKRRRKRLKWSQATSDSDESDDLLALTQSSKKADAETEKQKKKRLKRLRKASDREAAGQTDAPIIVIVDSDEDEDGEITSSSLNQITPEKTPTKRRKDKKEKKAKKVKKDTDKSNRKAGTSKEAEQEAEIAVEIDVDDFSDVDMDDDDASAHAQTTQQMLLGEIRCVCSVEKVGRYTGQWLQCWKEDCGAWQHAECVGCLVHRGDRNGLPEKYCCSTCDPEAFQKRILDATTKLRSWLSLCCESRNLKQLLKLLEESEQRDAAATRELAASTTGSKCVTLLMEAAHHGLAHAVRRLIRRYKVNVHVTDSHSCNVLSHAVSGGSVPVVTFLMNQYPALVRHQDLQGRMALHRMLQSCHLNSLCLPLLQKDQALCVTSTFDGFMPIHFACQAVNEHTVEIVRQILAVEPMAAIERSPERLTPLMYLCRASVDGLSGAHVDQKAAYIVEVIEMLLDVDVLGGFLNARDPRGWTPLHFVAEAGNHALLLALCLRPEVEIDAITFDSGETALHLAARANHTRSVDVLLGNRRRRLDVDAADGSQWIPVLRATTASCLHLLLHYDLDKQLLRIGNLARNFRHHEVLRIWMHRISIDPACHAIVNDWLQYNTLILDELDEMIRLHRSFVRVDNKLDFLYQSIFASIKRRSRRPSAAAAVTGADVALEESLPPPPPDAYTTEITLSSSSGECYWKQFVAQTRDYDALVFRHRLRIVISRGDSLRLDNLTLVLVRLLAGLLQPATGLLVRNEIDATLEPALHRHADDADTLREYYVLGELVAYLVLSNVAVGEVFEFSTAFLATVAGQATEPTSGPDVLALRVFAESFAAGFDAVVPATLRLLHPEELRMVLNARTHSLSVSTMDWASAVEWSGFDVAVRSENERQEQEEDGEVQDAVVVAWWTRMVSELVEDERVALVLWLAGSFRHAQRVLFAANEIDQTSVRIRIQRYQAAVSADADQGETNGVAQASATTAVDENELVPVFDRTARTLVLPQYSSYARFRSAVLRAFRHVDEVVTVR